MSSDARWTPSQREAIDRRHGDLLVAAGAGSGKTAVLVERFVAFVVQDGLEVGSLLAITFTDKAAGELRERIRARLLALGAVSEARATEAAHISTIHGFCARVLRGNALAAGLDPGFSVLDESEAQQLAHGAFDEAVAALAADAAGAVELLASYRPAALRAAILSVYGQLRSRGEQEPALPALAPVAGGGDDLESARSRLIASGGEVMEELGLVAGPSARVVQALERLERSELVLRSPVPWPGDLDALALPAGNGAALSTPLCVAYTEALAGFREGCERYHARDTHRLLDALLRDFGARYARAKRERSRVDFADLELMALALVSRDTGLRERYRKRFAAIMVDELQDTNRVQLELIELLASGNLFTVGDAQQSIYGFRHADVELFERRGRFLGQRGARATLQTNFRSRPEILAAVNRAFAPLLGERFMALTSGRSEPPVGEPLVELLIADKGADWAPEGLAAPWRLAEARALAARVRELVDGGTSPGQVVVLTRASTDLRAYERALEDLSVATYVIGGRGYWSHPQVLDIVGYLRALANPREEEALYGVLASPLVGASYDALVVLGSAGRAAGRDPWSVLREPEGRLDDLGDEDRVRLAGFAQWFLGERSAAAWVGAEALIERALVATGYDLAMLAMPGGRRRLANVRKLMRLAREWELRHGLGLRAFVDQLGGLHGLGGFGADARDDRESEAPVQSEALDAVALMTIHRAKGLEFDVVCVADLGRGPRYGAELLRVGADGRVGLMLGQPGTGRSEPALAYRELGEEQARRDREEERRLFYVAMTRARERLIVSGAAKLDAFGACGDVGRSGNGGRSGNRGRSGDGGRSGNGGRTPIEWIAPALMPDIGARIAERRGVADDGVAFAFVSPGEGCGEEFESIPPAPPPPVPAARPAAPLLSPSAPAPPSVRALSYSSLADYRRCGYRFYVERVLGLPPVPAPATAVDAPPTAISASARGILVHALLEQFDFRRPAAPSPQAIALAAQRAGEPAPDQLLDDVVALVAAFASSPLCRRLAASDGVRREERFSFVAGGGAMITGALDVLAREPGGRALVVDYKSDRLDREDPGEVVSSHYWIQRLIYAIAALRTGASEVEVAYVFLERPSLPVAQTFGAADRPRLEAQLDGLVADVLAGGFAVTAHPHHAVCGGCPAEGGLCSWPLAMTRREAPDRLF